MYYTPDFRYKDADFNGVFSEKLTKARDWLKNYTEHHNNLFICGLTGCGKTYLAMSFLNELSKKAKYVPPYTSNGLNLKGFYVLDGVEYVVSKQLFDTIKRQFSTNQQVAQDSQQSLQEYLKSDLLIIDEFGLGYGTDSELIELTDLIDYRWKKGLPTVFLSNLGMKSLMSYMKDRATQRAFDGADYVELKDTSLRSKPKEL